MQGPPSYGGIHVTRGMLDGRPAAAVFWSFELLALLLLPAAVVVFRAGLTTGNKVVLMLLAVALPVLGPIVAMVMARLVTPGDPSRDES